MIYIENGGASMPRNVIQYDLLISCPGDIKEELSLIEQAVNEFNTMFSDTLGISIRTKHWSKNSYAQSGGKPQELLNKQFVNDCDAAVALFWTRFGTPTDAYGSGTEEEIEIMLGAGKQVFLYFSDKPISPSQNNPSEYSRVQAFREKYKGRGLYFNYNSDDEFYKLFFAHLTQHFMSEKRVEEVRSERASSLSLQGINIEGKLSDTAIYQPFKLNTERTLQGEKESIKELIYQISKIHVQALDGNCGSLHRGLRDPIEVDSEWIDVIKTMAEVLKVDLSEDFFCVGNLRKNLLSTPSLFGAPNYDGTDEEKRKFGLIQELYFKILEALNWANTEDEFKNLMCVKLALTNTGTAMDDEIDITIKIPQEQYLSLSELPTPDKETARFLTRDCDLYDLLSIPSTAEYGDYESSIESPTPVVSPHTPSIFPNDIDYIEDFKEELENVFCYEVYIDGENCVIKLRVDHLKHHKSIAFPAPLLLKKKPEKINYTITSINSADVIEGELSIK